MVSVADAIRSKTGGSDPLSFPTGFSEAIEGISGGGSGGPDADTTLLDKLSKGYLGSNSDIESIDISSSDFDGASLPIYLGQEVVPSYMAYKRRIKSLSLNDTRLYDSKVFGECNFFYCTTFEISTSATYMGGLFANSTYVPGWPSGYNPSRTMTTMFNSCSFSGDVVVPEGVETIASGCLSSIIGVQGKEITLTLPASLTVIESGYGVVSGTSIDKLPLVMLATSPPTLKSANTLTNILSITVPKGSLNAYQTATNWSQFADIMVEAEE